MKSKTKTNSKPKKKSAKQQPKEDFNQATFRVMKEIIKRSESRS